MSITDDFLLKKKKSVIGCHVPIKDMLALLNIKLNLFEAFLWFLKVLSKCNVVEAFVVVHEKKAFTWLISNFSRYIHLIFF